MIQMIIVLFTILQKIENNFFLFFFRYMNKISTDKYFVHLNNIEEIDISSIIFLIDDCESLNVNDIVPEHVLYHIIAGADLSTIKKEITLLIKYLIINHDTFRDNKDLKKIVDSISDPKHIPFLGYFYYLYHNLSKVEKKYQHKKKIEYHYYFYDHFYLD